MKKATSSCYGINSSCIKQIDSSTFLVTQRFSREEYPFLSDHTVNGECLFPGAMMLELMAECGNVILPADGPIIMENFRILRPVRISGATVLKLYARIESEGIQMSLCADFVKSGQVIRKDIVYAESFYTVGSIDTDIDRDIFHDENVRCFSLDAKDIYFRDFMQSGPFYHGLGKELCFSETHFQGSIGNSPGNCDYLVEPIIIDNCFQLGNIGTGIVNGYAGLPVGMDRLCFINKLPGQKAYCYGMVKKFEDQAVIQNFIVCDEFDTVILSASGVRQHYIGRFNFDVMNHILKAHERTM